jgi:hypothetical protein
MKNRLAIATIAFAAFSLPALAAADYYVVKNETTKKCEISETKPDGKTAMMVGTAMHKTKAEAETAMKAAADCK